MDSSITKNKGNALKMNKNIFIKMIFNAFYTFLSKTILPTDIWNGVSSCNSKNSL